MIIDCRISYRQLSERRGEEEAEGGKTNLEIHLAEFFGPGDEECEADVEMKF